MNVPETLSLRKANPKSKWPLWGDTSEYVKRLCACKWRTLNKNASKEEEANAAISKDLANFFKGGTRDVFLKFDDATEGTTTNPLLCQLNQPPFENGRSGSHV